VTVMVVVGSDGWRGVAMVRARLLRERMMVERSSLLLRCVVVC
jgi:hypothetical protein